jgi:sec-independent protein translocase protein TatA
VLSNIGPLEVGIVLLVVLLVFGPKRLPDLGSSLGHGIRDFGRGLKGDGKQEGPDSKAEKTAHPLD